MIGGIIARPLETGKPVDNFTKIMYVEQAVRCKPKFEIQNRQFT